MSDKPQTIRQRENSKLKVLRKLVANARNIISCEVGTSIGCWKMQRYIYWLEEYDIRLRYSVFHEYAKAVRAIPSGKERLYCSREALTRYDADLNQINLYYHEQIIDACFGLIRSFGEVVDNQNANKDEQAVKLVSD